MSSPSQFPISTRGQYLCLLCSITKYDRTLSTEDHADRRAMFLRFDKIVRSRLKVSLDANPGGCNSFVKTEGGITPSLCEKCLPCVKRVMDRSRGLEVATIHLSNEIGQFADYIQKPESKVKERLQSFAETQPSPLATAATNLHALLQNSAGDSTLLGSPQLILRRQETPNAAILKTSSPAEKLPRKRPALQTTKTDTKNSKVTEQPQPEPDKDLLKVTFISSEFPGKYQIVCRRIHHASGSIFLTVIGIEKAPPALGDKSSSSASTRCESNVLSPSVPKRCKSSSEAGGELEKAVTRQDERKDWTCALCGLQYPSEILATHPKILA